jgi:single-stranded-DNA-specific exonuclease
MRRLSRPRTWRTVPRDRVLEDDLSAHLGLHPLAAAALVAAGITNAQEARAYLSGSLADLPPPTDFRGMADAVEAAARALADRRPILLHGDYDADGICSTAILVRLFHALGGVVHYYLPDRFRDDYGVSERAIRAAVDKGVDFILTADCGISAHDEIAVAKSLGCTVVVLDHHEPGPTLPEADVVVAPRLPDWSYRWPDMPASALALRFAQAMLEAVGDAPLRVEDLADIAAIGVIADVAPMIGENRIIARAGLDALAGTHWLGIKALMDVAAVRPPVRAYDVAFRLAPRLNAAGRLADATDALDLLLTHSAEEARRLALYLDGKNRERQQIQDRIYREAAAMLGARPELLELPAVVLGSPDWHPGVIGVVAARLVDDYGRPAILFAETPELARGSARSTDDVDIIQALRCCEECLLDYGGHPGAAGVRVPVGGVERLRDALARSLEAIGTRPAAAAEAEALPATLDEIDEALVADLARLEPFGPGNPEPFFATDGVEIIEARTVGREGQHLKLYLSDGGKTVEAIGWSMAPTAGDLRQGDRLDICFTAALDDYWGRPQAQLRLVAWRPSAR